MSESLPAPNEKSDERNDKQLSATDASHNVPLPGSGAPACAPLRRLAPRKSLGNQVVLLVRLRRPTALSSRIAAACPRNAARGTQA